VDLVYPISGNEVEVHVRLLMLGPPLLAIRVDHGVGGPGVLDEGLDPLEQIVVIARHRVDKRPHLLGPEHVISDVINAEIDLLSAGELREPLLQVAGEIEHLVLDVVQDDVLDEPLGDRPRLDRTLMATRSFSSCASIRSSEWGSSSSSSRQKSRIWPLSTPYLMTFS
jgi:hypothetical protein